MEITYPSLGKQNDGCTTGEGRIQLTLCCSVPIVDVQQTACPSVGFTFLKITCRDERAHSSELDAHSSIRVLEMLVTRDEHHAVLESIPFPSPRLAALSSQ
ncbi:hypothetical protein GDO78_016167 [Eleutherodactylus coqui]|uniref:Uncharacterized protein n=1 Tax=Eleutherodactylus coqui TaxID=57060 RepID=A0A8J6BKF0_ELECQ|nr:hypothetical protein GDO78_016167 [Eleutherodactylus coqui]